MLYPFLYTLKLKHKQWYNIVMIKNTILAGLALLLVSGCGTSSIVSKDEQRKGGQNRVNITSQVPQGEKGVTEFEIVLAKDCDKCKYEASIPLADGNILTIKVDAEGVRGSEYAAILGEVIKEVALSDNEAVKSVLPDVLGTIAKLAGPL